MTINVTQRIDGSTVGPYQRRIVAICALVALLDGLDIQTMAIALPRLSAAWGMEPASFGPVLSASFAGIMAGTMGLGWLGDRYGRRVVVLIAFLALGASSIATAFASSITMLVILRFITGAAIGGCLPNVTALTSEYIPARRGGVAVTLMYAAVPLGGVIGSLAAGNLIAIVDWQGIFLLGGIIPLFVWVILFFWLPESVRYMVVRGGNEEKVGRILQRIDGTYTHRAGDDFTLDHITRPGRFGDLFNEGRFTRTSLLWVTFFFSMSVMYLLTSWLPAIFAAAGWSTPAAIRTLALFQCGGIVGGLLGGWLLDRIGPFRVLTSAFAIGTMAIVLIGFTGVNSAIVHFLVALAGFGIVGAQLVLTAVSATLYPTTIRSTGIGWALGIGRFGAVVSPWLGGLAIGAGIAGPQLFLFAAIPALLSTLAATALGRTAAGSVAARLRANA